MYRMESLNFKDRCQPRMGWLQAPARWRSLTGPLTGANQNQSTLTLNGGAQQNLTSLININAVNSNVNVLLNLNVNINSTVGTIMQSNLTGKH